MDTLASGETRQEEILIKKLYYPFGMALEGMIPDSTIPPARFLYNNKEFEAAGGVYFYGARLCVPVIGRFAGVDPLAEKYAAWSPYNYTLNNPILLVDPDGRGVENIGVNSSGAVVFDDGKDDGNLFLVNDGVGEISNLEQLKSNSVQLAKDHVWVGSNADLISYTLSQMNFVDNISTSDFMDAAGNLYIDVKSSIKGTGTIAVKGGFGITPILSSFSKITSYPDNNSLVLEKATKDIIFSNPYNTRSALGHEGVHVSQNKKLNQILKGENSWCKYEQSNNKSCKRI